MQPDLQKHFCRYAQAIVISFLFLTPVNQI